MRRREYCVCFFWGRCLFERVLSVAIYGCVALNEWQFYFYFLKLIQSAKVLLLWPLLLGSFAIVIGNTRFGTRIQARAWVRLQPETTEISSVPCLQQACRH